MGVKMTILDSRETYEALCCICKQNLYNMIKKPSCRHKIGKYTVDVWFDGEILIYYHNQSVELLQLRSTKVLTEEYIDKLLLLR